MPKIVILGGGVAGTRVANRLLKARRDLDVTVVDSHGDHLFQPAILYVPFRGEDTSLVRDERALLRPGVRLLVERVLAVEPDAQRVRFESGVSLDYDWLVIATGSQLTHDTLPGGREANLHFHCRTGALRLHEALSSFRGGDIVVGAASLPYKCPPSPVEFTFLLDDWLREKGLREATRITYAYPLPDIQPLAPVSKGVRPLFEERGVAIETSFTSPAIDPARRTVTGGGRTLPFDLLVMVPPHAAAPYLRGADLAEPGGWVKTDPRTLRVRDRVYALGDTTNLARPKSGSVAHFQADVVAANLLAEIAGGDPETQYDGRAVCFLETGGGRAMMIDFAYDRAPVWQAPDRRTFWKKSIFRKFYFQFARRA